MSSLSGEAKIGSRTVSYGRWRARITCSMARASRSEGDAAGGQLKNRNVKAATVRCPNPQIPSHHTPHSREGSNGVVAFLDTTTAAMGDADAVKPRLTGASQGR